MDPGKGVHGHDNVTDPGVGLLVVMAFLEVVQDGRFVEKGQIGHVSFAQDASVGRQVLEGQLSLGVLVQRDGPDQTVHRQLLQIQHGRIGRQDGRVVPIEWKRDRYLNRMVVARCSSSSCC